MSDKDSSPLSENIFYPIAVIGLSVAIMFIWEWTLNSRAREMLVATREALQRTRDQSIPAFQQSQTLQANLQKLASDLIDLAATDKDAQAIVRKYQIQRSGPAGAAPGPAPAAPTPAPAPSPTPKP